MISSLLSGIGRTKLFEGMFLHDSLTHMQLKSEMKFSLFFIKLEVKLLFSVGPHSVDGGGAMPGVLVGGGVVSSSPGPALLHTGTLPGGSKPLILTKLTITFVLMFHLF